MGIQQFRRKVFAKYYDRIARGYDEAMSEQKRELFTALQGVVVELGPGTGANLRILPQGVSWIGIEPNEHMHEQLRKKANELGVEVDLRCQSAGRLPLEDASVDSVLSTLVLCSVSDVPAVLAEVRRVLKPGGRFVFWEHVIEPRARGLRVLQHLLTPLQRTIADGCRCNRDFAAFVNGAGFEEVQLQSFRVPSRIAPPWIRPHVSGVAIR